MRTLSAPMRSLGCTSVVSVGRVYSENSSPSMPITEQSPGTLRPRPFQIRPVRSSLSLFLPPEETHR